MRVRLEWVLAAAFCGGALHPRRPGATRVGGLAASHGDGDDRLRVEGGERQVCAGDTSAGVALVKSTGPAACLLGKTWGYDDKGVWVSNGCNGEFIRAKRRVKVCHRPRHR
jgi:hypothetical protein